MEVESYASKMPFKESDPLTVGHLYSFRPTSNLPKLLIYRSPLPNCTNAFVIRRESILIVLGKTRDYFKIACSGCEGWINLSRELLSDVKVFKPIDHYRLYEDWRGNNYFLFEGRLMLGSHAAFFGVALLYILIFSAIFFLYVGKKLQHHTNLIILWLLLSQASCRAILPMLRLFFLLVPPLIPSPSYVGSIVVLAISIDLLVPNTVRLVKTVSWNLIITVPLQVIVLDYAIAGTSYASSTPLVLEEARLHHTSDMLLNNLLGSIELIISATVLTYASLTV
eukprot:scaffold1438_cov173-Ochromonas_danica.AAC.9